MTVNHTKETYPTNVNLDSYPINKEREDRAIRIGKVAICIWRVIEGLTFATALSAGLATFITAAPAAATVALITGIASGIFAFIEIYFGAINPRLPFKARALGNLVRAGMLDFFIAATSSVLVFVKHKNEMDQPIGTQRPVLLVHGHSSFSGIWSYIKHRLNTANVGPIYTVELGKTSNPIPKHAETLQKKIEKIAKKTGRSDISLIGHSMGGLVNGEYLTKMASHRTVKDFASLGSPWCGTTMARFSSSRSAKQMRHCSRYVMDLAHRVQNVASTRFLFIGSKADAVVRPATSPYLTTRKVSYKVFKDLGHTQMLFSDRVADTLIDFLRNRT